MLIGIYLGDRDLRLWEVKVSVKTNHNNVDFNEFLKH
jgi:hypothetical protein